MRTVIVGAILFLALSAISLSQTAPPVTSVIREDSLSVGLVFKSDSVNLGFSDNEKWLQIINDGSVTLYVAFGNDTASGKFIRIKPVAANLNENILTILRVSKNVKYIRTRAEIGRAHV